MVGGVGGVAEIVLHHVEDHRCALRVEIDVDRVLLPAQVAFQHEAARAHHAFGMDAALRHLGLELGKDARPVRSRLDNVHGEADEAHSRLHHQGKRQVGWIERAQLVERALAEEMRGVHARERPARFGLVLAQADAAVQLFVVHVLEHPSKAVFRARVDALAAIGQRGGGFVIDQVQVAPLAHEPLRELVAQHGMLRSFQPIEHKPGGIRRFENEHETTPPS